MSFWDDLYARTGLRPAGDPPGPDGEHRCPSCDVVVIGVHSCTQHWEDPSYGLTGSTTTTCTLLDDGTMFVSKCGESSASGIGAVMLMGSPTVEKWFMGLDPDGEETPR